MTHEPSTSAVAGEAAHTQAGADAQGPQRRPHAASGQVPATLVPETGWHFLHLFYRVDRDRLRGFTALEPGIGPSGAAQRFWRRRVLVPSSSFRSLPFRDTRPTSG